MTAIDPEDVKQTLGNIRELSGSLSEQATRIGPILDRADAVAANAQTFSDHLPALGERAEALIAAIDPERVDRSLANIDTFAAMLGENSEDIDRIVGDARALSSRFDAMGRRADSLLAKLDGMAGSQPGGIMEDATATLAAIKAAADNFNAQISILGGGVTDFSDRGLRDLQGLVTEGQRTIGRLDRVISNLERNPAGFLLGGENVPEYGGRRR
jgi:phospholipid/cholesterol/gamma-HCH transport system substrate-binding protein